MADALPFWVLRLLIGFAVLGYGSYSDVLTRKASNALWVIMACGGAAVMGLELHSTGTPPVLLLGPVICLAVFLCIIFEGELLPKGAGETANKAFMLIIIVGSIGGLYAMSTAGDAFFNFIAMVIVIMFVFYMFYAVHLIQGGADAKALMSIAILCPWYPPEDLPFVIATLPDLVTAAIPFSLSMLFNAVIMFLVVPLGFAIYNAAKGDFASMMFFGYKMRLEEIEKNFVWPMQRVKGRKVITVLFPSRDGLDIASDVKALKKIGKREAWVTPKLPFLVPMTLAFPVTVIFGNLILGLMLSI